MYLAWSFKRTYCEGTSSIRIPNLEFASNAVDVIQKVKSSLNKPFRPDLPKLIDSDANVEILSLTENCWAENPHDRPDISAVLRKLRQINKGRYQKFIN